MASSWKSLFTLCIFATLLFSTMESYMCIQCTGEKCIFSPGTCEASQGCFNNKQQFISPGNPLVTTEERGCSSTACTPLAFSATLERGLTFRYETQCCMSDKCNGGDIRLSQESGDYNGIECPACYSENGTFCSPQPLKCTGAETKCVEIFGLGSIGDNHLLAISGMGCATESACNLRGMNVTQSPINIRTYCRGPVGGSRALTPVASSTLAGLLLLKILLKILL